MFVETLHVYSTVGHRMRKEVGMGCAFSGFFYGNSSVALLNRRIE